ncbi:MAG TPA: hypothetical protein VGK20_12205 [Candidatus Binatia bacterium]|jgi:hypothetical protein
MPIHTRLLRILALAVVLVGRAMPALALPPAAEVMTALNLSADDQKQVLAGQYVSHDAKTLNDRDLSVSIAFLVKASPDSLAKQVASGDLIKVDSQVKKTGIFSDAGSIADLAGLTIDAAAAKTLAGASAGSSLNLATPEIAALSQLKAGEVASVQAQLQRMLLARYQAYRTSGLAGIAPYDRGGSRSDPGADLKTAAEATAGLKKYLPSFYNLVTRYPQATSPGVQQTMRWIKYDIDGTETYVLSHAMVVADGDARAVVNRQYYVSTGYNAGQAVAGFLPVAEGTVVLYNNHTFTDQVAGFGGSAKRGIGRRMMESKLRAIFDKQKKKVEH